MKGIVISYVYDAPGVDGEVVNDMPCSYRQHLVADVYDSAAITKQVKTERGNVPKGSFVDWVR